MAGIFSAWISISLKHCMLIRFSDSFSLTGTHDKLGHIYVARLVHSIFIKGADLTYAAEETFVRLFLLLPSGIQLKVVVLINPPQVEQLSKVLYS